jgi:hypothetical protein
MRFTLFLLISPIAVPANDLSDYLEKPIFWPECFHLFPVGDNTDARQAYSCLSCQTLEALRSSEPFHLIVQFS